MSVKVGNLVTDEKNVKEVLSVEDGEQMMSRSSVVSGNIDSDIFGFQFGNVGLVITVTANEERFLGAIVNDDSIRVFKAQFDINGNKINGGYKDLTAYN